MTQFVFNLWNHNKVGQRSLEDVIGIIGRQLQALGHTAVWDQKNEQFVTNEFGVNIVVEGFTESSIRTIAQLHERGARFIILATEEPTEKGFNHGTQVEMVKRQKMFPEAAKFCEGIIHLVPGEHITKWFGQFAPAAYTELGYAPALVRKEDGVVPDFDFGFYGSVSPRRLKLLKKLANRTGRTIKIMADFGTQADRDKQMRRARVILQIRKFEEMGLVSSSRCNTALCLGRPVVAEPHDLCKPWDEIVRFSHSQDGFFADAMMAWATWRGMHSQQMAKFKEKLPPELCIGAALKAIRFDEKKIAA